MKTALNGMRIRTSTLDGLGINFVFNIKEMSQGVDNHNELLVLLPLMIMILARNFM